MERGREGGGRERERGESHFRGACNGSQLQCSTKREVHTPARYLPLALTCWRGYPKDIACRGLAFTRRLRAVNRPDRCQPHRKV
jgi:hypothetical protein